MLPRSWLCVVGAAVVLRGWKVPGLQLVLLSARGVGQGKGESGMGCGGMAPWAHVLPMLLCCSCSWLMQSTGGGGGEDADRRTPQTLPCHRAIRCSCSENRSLPFFTFKSYFCTWFCLTSVASPGPLPTASQRHRAGLRWGQAAVLGTGGSVPSPVLVQFYH